MNELNELMNASSDALLFETGRARIAFCPSLTARVFCELNGAMLHRIDLDNIRRPDKPFNNYGGLNLWPAPEGGQFGFNYKGDQWYVQPAINNEPYKVLEKSADSAKVIKNTTLVNRKGTAVKTAIARKFDVVPIPSLIRQLDPVAACAYTLSDSIEVLNKISVNEALIACWTLEQFNASDSTISFVIVKDPHKAVNFDFYDDPREKISYCKRGLLYHTDSKKRGQIGIKKDSLPQGIGFYDLSRNLLCLREIVGVQPGLYFNIADNDQPAGPFSAADVYSIFNGDESLGFFELETIGSANVVDDRLSGSSLVSRTTLAFFKNDQPIHRLFEQENS